VKIEVDRGRDGGPDGWEVDERRSRKKEEDGRRKEKMMV